MGWQMPAGLTDEDQAWVRYHLMLAGYDIDIDRISTMSLSEYTQERVFLLARLERAQWNS